VIRALVLVALVLPLAACDLSMRKQARYDPQAAGSLWADGSASRLPPDGVVAVDDAAEQAAAKQPAAVDMALLQRGRDRFTVFCSPCHGVDGEGDGRVVQRGFPRPPSYADPRLRALSGQQIFDIITGGYGVMYPYADRIAPKDRWAVVAYVRALQTAKDQPAAMVPPGVVPQEPAR
jgi:mono/diheme cytochrome c family protein